MSRAASRYSGSDALSVEARACPPGLAGCLCVGTHSGGVRNVDHRDSLRVEGRLELHVRRTRKRTAMMMTTGTKLSRRMRYFESDMPAFLMLPLPEWNAVPGRLRSGSRAPGRTLISSRTGPPWRNGDVHAEVLERHGPGRARFISTTRSQYGTARPMRVHPGVRVLVHGISFQDSMDRAAARGRYPRPRRPGGDSPFLRTPSSGCGSWTGPARRGAGSLARRRRRGSKHSSPRAARCGLQ